ncbi:uncharacterized protein LOC136034976 [Artemia franciscana]|uniref:Uncharacterized protein n=1 Tax=Artemia franciscana TaxID=6661 RepID=A0AA88LA82_ARTSF|nr:hypothetical protein QYM36_003207 [Artemia franciscana]
MPMFQLDKLLEKGKEGEQQVLDLAEATANDAEEFQNLFSRVPELKTFKIRPEKVRVHEVKESISISECEDSSCFKLNNDPRKKAWLYSNPIPPSMQKASIPDLATKNIPWKMLTDAKPKTKTEEEYFTRLIELAKQNLSLKLHESKISKPMGNAPRQLTRRLVTSEFKVKSCPMCLEELCCGEVCMTFGYEPFARKTTSSANEESKKEDVLEKKVDVPFRMGPPKKKFPRNRHLKHQFKSGKPP